MSDLHETLVRYRRRIRLGRAAEATIRASFWVSIAVCAWLVAEKAGGFALSRAAVTAALAGVPLALGLRAWARPFELRECAIHLDRLLGLDERLSTALEASGPLGGALASDAAAALSRAPLPPRRFPREGRLLAGSGLLMAVLLAIPAPSLSRASDGPGPEALSDDQLKALESLGKVEIEFQEASGLVREGKLEEALTKFQALRERLAEKLLQAGGRGSDLQKAHDAADAAAQAVAARLQSMGRVAHAPPPRTIGMKMERQALEAIPEEPAETRSRILSKAGDLRGDWPPRYDDIVLKYFDALMRRKP